MARRNPDSCDSKTLGASRTIRHYLQLFSLPSAERPHMRWRGGLSRFQTDNFVLAAPQVATSTAFPRSPGMCSASALDWRVSDVDARADPMPRGWPRGSVHSSAETPGWLAAITTISAAFRNSLASSSASAEGASWCARPRTSRSSLGF